MLRQNLHQEVKKQSSLDKWIYMKHHETTSVISICTQMNVCVFVYIDIYTHIYMVIRYTHTMSMYYGSASVSHPSFIILVSFWSMWIKHIHLFSSEKRALQHTTPWFPVDFPHDIVTTSGQNITYIITIHIYIHRQIITYIITQYIYQDISGYIRCY